MLRDQRPEISRSGKSAAQDPHRDARRHGSGALLRVEGQFCECACGYSFAQEGSPQIRVLVGGLTAWKARGFPLDTVTTELAERIAEMKRLGIELIPSPWSPPPAEAPPASD